jgi:Nif-specific regulatory protein
VYTYLTMTSGSRAGTNYLLDSSEENRIGRGLECAIVLTDPLCSRVHAIVSFRDNAWKIADSESRNGSYVNGQKIDDAVLTVGNQIRLGSTEFTFEQSTNPPAFHRAGISVTQTLIKNQAMAQSDAVAFRGLAAFSDSQQAQELLLLYQLSIKLLGCDDPDEVIRVAIELLADWTHATLAGFLWISDDGQLKPKILIPLGASDAVALSKSLTDLVCQQKNAVWVANEAVTDSVESLKHYADALCVPLIFEGSPLGAIHVYLEHGRFRQMDFDFAISLANIASVALARARRESRIHTDYQHLVDQSPGHSEMIGESRPMRELKSRINRLARATGCVLVRGESGVGKELVARALHRASLRADRPMLSVNCAAIPDDLMESQLFGHKAGSFTGADRDHVGYFQQADLGTLFLDEVGEMTLDGQAKLLRILEGHPFHPVGSTEEVSADVRVIAATNQDLQTYVRQKKFREDLYYRLSVFELAVPPLRERGEDIGRLVDFFFDHFRRQHGRPGLGIAPEARAKLLGYQWPGNVRQLRNVIDSAVVLAEGDQIEVGDLGLRGVASGELETLELEVWERRLIAEALRRTDGNIPEAAKLLGIGRATLYRKVDEYGIAREGGRTPLTER